MGRKADLAGFDEDLGLAPTTLDAELFLRMSVPMKKTLAVISTYKAVPMGYLVRQAIERLGSIYPEFDALYEKYKTEAALSNEK
jgi:hypothetical protein